MIKKDLEASLKNAMKSGDALRRDILRVVLTNIKLAEVEKGSVLDDATIITLLQKEVKTHKESIAEAQKANRDDLVTQYQKEAVILAEFLPDQMSEAELRAFVQSAIDEAGAKSPADMGKVIKLVLPKMEGRAPNSEVSRIVREMLS